MQTNRVWAVYWSATGTTKTVVTAIASAMADKLGVSQEEYDFMVEKQNIAKAVVL